MTLNTGGMHQLGFTTLQTTQHTIDKAGELFHAELACSLNGLGERSMIGNTHGQ